MKFMENKQSKIDDNIIARPPIVAVMGHIDHGKTKLLDAVRKTNIIDCESGGITQHVGAYEVVVKSDNPEYNGRKITFLDTPGHEAFSKIRERGALVGDVAVLVVAADEGVKKQTLEALKHIKEAGLPFLVAINKIDKPEANPDKTKQQLAENEVFLEGWGGNTPFVLISAKEGKNINELLETILLLSDLEDLKADKKAIASGVVIEARMDNQRGIVASLIIKQGVLKQGEEIITKSASGKIKILEDSNRKIIKEATFSSPVSMIGFKEIPKVGEEFFSSPKLDLTGILKLDNKKTNKPTIQSKKIVDKNSKIFNLIIKADVAGSLEALNNLLEDLFKKREKEFQIINSGVGDITSSDIKMAQSTGSWLVGFRSKVPKDLAISLDVSKVKTILFDVIYEFGDVFNKIFDEMENEEEKTQKGELKVLVVFSSQGKKKLIGGSVEAGKLKKGRIRIVREENELGIGRILGLQCQKVVINEANEGTECGLMIETNINIEKGDLIVLEK